VRSDEARNLLGGYATGSLTEGEKTALFQAALEDQELFDELADEQVLKEVLDEPGARQRLLVALEAPRRHRAWLWAGAVATAAVAVVIGIVVSQRTQPPPQEIAQVLKSPEPAAPLEPAVPPVAPPRPAPPPLVKRKVAPPVTPAAPELQKAEAENKLADQLQPANPQAPEALRGLVAGTAPAVARFRAENATASAPVAFSFNYSVGSDGFLQIVPMAPGYLSVSASGTVLFPSNEVSQGTPVRVAIPSGAASLVISFSRTEGIAGTPVRRDAPTGRETDQDPPNGRILIQLFLKPVTQ